MDEPQTQIITLPSLTLEQAGILADDAAADSLFADYQRRLAEETRRRHRADFALFTRYLASAGIPIGNLMTDPNAWRGMSWGLLQGFVEWPTGCATSFWQEGKGDKTAPQRPFTLLDFRFCGYFASLWHPSMR